MEIRQAISMYLTAKAYNEPEFKTKFENPAKNLDECVMFIQYKMLEKVTEEQKKDGAACVIPSDDEIFALAVQYYIDEDIKIDGDKFNNVRIFSLSATTFTEEEKQQQRQEAIRRYQDEIISDMKKKEKERLEKKKAKKTASPILVPDTHEQDEQKSEAETAKQLSLF